jgi:hypothetical protein
MSFLKNYNKINDFENASPFAFCYHCEERSDVVLSVIASDSEAIYFCFLYEIATASLREASQ